LYASKNSTASEYANVYIIGFFAFIPFLCFTFALEIIVLIALFSCLFKDKLAGTNCVFPPIRALRSSNTGFAF
jgi:hypothetical protein